MEADDEGGNVKRTEEQWAEKVLRDEHGGGGCPGHRALPFSPTATSVSHPTASIPAEPPKWLPPDAHAIINIYFAVTHTPNSRTDLCQERSKKCLSFT